MLFEENDKEYVKGTPLAARMRPRTLDEIAGQQHILGEGKLLRRLIEADRVYSIILWGPPGIGKTSLASVIANATGARFCAINAVTAGVADIRATVEDSRQERYQNNRPTVLFIDEIHRFNKLQQDALLPHLESGLLRLIGATIHNPHFALNSAVLSRCQLFRLQPLTLDDLNAVLERALNDKEHGLGNIRLFVDEKARSHLVRAAEGDARRLLTALEVAALTTPPQADGLIFVDEESAIESISRPGMRYDSNEDEHYDTISAFIKSIRGSDPDAAIYWLAKMIGAGEDPRFIARRLVISAAEDVGNADPHALMLANAALNAVSEIGMPEARIPLAQVTIYLAMAPKSNRAYLAISKALAAQQDGDMQPVPIQLRNVRPGELEEAMASSESYLYPHDYPEAWVMQEYMLEPREFYEPSPYGFEARMKERLDAIRARMKTWRDKKQSEKDKDEGTGQLL